MLIGKNAKIWAVPPTRPQAEEAARHFFALLQQGLVTEAHDSLAHRFADWHSQLWSLWQDTCLIHLSLQQPPVYPKNTGYKSKTWQADWGWLAPLEVDGFRWQRGRLKNEFYATLRYAGQQRDVTANFSLQPTPQGIVLVRESIRVM